MVKFRMFSSTPLTSLSIPAKGLYLTASATAPEATVDMNSKTSITDIVQQSSTDYTTYCMLLYTFYQITFIVMLTFMADR